MSKKDQVVGTAVNITNIFLKEKNPHPREDGLDSQMGDQFSIHAKIGERNDNPQQMDLVPNTVVLDVTRYDLHGLVEDGFLDVNTIDNQGRYEIPHEDGESYELVHDALER